MKCVCESLRVQVYHIQYTIGMLLQSQPHRVIVLHKNAIALFKIVQLGSLVGMLTMFYNE